MISEIARKKKIPLKFLENILPGLKKADISVSKKGKGGGHFLKKNPDKVKVATVIRLINGPIAMLPCVSPYFYKRCKNYNENHCGLHDMMIQVTDATLNIIENPHIKRSRGLIHRFTNDCPVIFF